jgi:putative transposase
MNEQPDKRQEEVALFRYGVIADLVHLESGTSGLYRRIRDRWSSPQRCPAHQTIRRWLVLYRKGGLDALCPSTRSHHNGKEQPR